MIPAERIALPIADGTTQPTQEAGRRTRRLTALPLVTVLLLIGLLLAALMGVEHHRASDVLTIETAVPMRAESLALPWDGPPRVVTVHIGDTAGALAAYFRRLDYSLSPIRAGAEVPRVYVHALPRDMGAVEPVGQRKALFLRSVLPLVLKENERLRAQRRRLLAIREALRAGDALAPVERKWLDRQYARYDVDPADANEQAALDALLLRVDSVPVSLALAQAAMESAWGTSRFLKEGNALFGMWTWKDSQPGIVPRERSEDARHRVRAFPTLQESVRAYLHTLNTHWAYDAFRTARAQLRRGGQEPGGLALAGAVGMYSEKRNRYTSMLRSLIRVNGLHRLDGAMLSGSRTLLASADARAVAMLERGHGAMVAQGSGR